MHARKGELKVKMLVKIRLFQRLLTV